MAGSKSWTPQSYPVQSAPPPPPPPPPPQTELPPLSPGQMAESQSPTSPTELPKENPQIPRNIRAVRDGNNTKLLGRNIIVCLDGTGDKFDADNSNIVHLVSCLKKADPSQITYYQSGIGTYDGGGLSNGINASLDMAVGSGLGVHIRDAYHFLMQNYQEHDRIHLFGFSRGAYTARCLSGMIHKVGLLPAHNVSQIPFAYEYYKDDTPHGWKMSIGFKRTFCMDVSVHFIGVFDSVASVGFIPRRLPLSSTPWNKANYFRHAMALDEHRAKFKVCRFQHKDRIGREAHWETVAEEHDQANGHVAQPHTNGVSTKHEKYDAVTDLHTKRRRDAERAKQTDVLEVWFAGGHADVGGGAVKNEERHKLAQIPLRWMIRQCFECDTGIIFKAHRLMEEGIDVHTLFPLYTPQEIPSVGPPPSFMEKYESGGIAPISRRSTVLQPVDDNDPQGLHNVNIWADDKKAELSYHWVPEQVEDYFDAMASINDQLAHSRGWWVLEAWPIKVRVQPKDSDEWIKKVRMNLGRYRPVQESAPNLHWTVQQRMRAHGYEIRTRLDRHAVWKIVV